MTSPIARTSHVAFRVTDLARSRVFYEKALNLHVIGTDPAGRLYLAADSEDTAPLLILEQAADANARPRPVDPEPYIGMEHWAFELASDDFFDLQAAWRRLNEIGAEIHHTIDPRVTEMQRSKELAPIYRSAMTKAQRMEALLDGARMEGEAWACSASMYYASRYAEGRILLVGDAATFLDPVSSFGVKKALASAWRAAVVVHTALEKPEMETAAVGLHEGRERRVYASYSDQVADVFQAASQDHRHEFWERRGELAEGAAECRIQAHQRWLH